VRILTVTLERLEAIEDFCQNQSLMKILVRKLKTFQMEWVSVSLSAFNDWIKHQNRISNELYYTPYEREQRNIGTNQSIVGTC
jgi:hypothetical protein